jgi:glycosyltransferase involved in cell wall biosynthesis
MKPWRILYYCFDSTRAFGGEKHSYQHVDILRSHGYDAYVVHTTPGFRLKWFANDTPVMYVPDITPDPERDVVVLPETLGERIRRISGRKVIFNKNLYHGFDALAVTPDGARAYLDEDVVAIISVSPHNTGYLSFAYPNKPIVEVRANIRPELYTCRPLSTKRLQIAYSTKAGAHWKALYQILHGRAASGLTRMADVAWIPVADLTEPQVVALLEDSLCFVFLSVHEGLPRLPLEAMAAGCLVYAYENGPHAVYLPSAYRFANGDLLSMARHIESVVAAYPDNLGHLDVVTGEARRIAESYSSGGQELSVVATWDAISELLAQHEGVRR